MYPDAAAVAAALVAARDTETSGRHTPLREQRPEPGHAKSPAATDHDTLLLQQSYIGLYWESQSGS